MIDGLNRVRFAADPDLLAAWEERQQRHRARAVGRAGGRADRNAVRNATA